MILLRWVMFFFQTKELSLKTNQTVALCADSLKQNSIELTLKLEGNLPLIQTDHIQIEQVLMNLIRNFSLIAGNT